MDNTLYYGDNLDILKRYIPDESVDLVYLDPPFKSDQNYNVLFKEKNGSEAASQIRAFEDTWTWDQEDEAVFADIVTKGGKLADCLQAFRTLMGPCDMLAYLVMMAPRLVELRRIMKPLASIYLHCDEIASHYLKILMDSIFSIQNFRNAITWKRTFSHGNVSKNYGAVCDNLLWYSKGNQYVWNQLFTPFAQDYVEKTFKYKDPDGRRWQSVTLRNPGQRPNLYYPFTASNGITYQPHPNGWSCDITRMKQYVKENRLHYPAKPDGALRLKMYLDESPGIRLQNLWDDIPPIGAQAAERLGYPTQKPEALLERIIRTNSNEGDLVLDPFCGCGTTIAAAQKTGRRWIGIDITHLAITLMKTRLSDAFGDQLSYKVIGEPTSIPDAEALAASDPYQFQWWALGLVGARPIEEKKGADKGIDGKIVFQGDAVGKFEQVIISVKAGHTGRDHVHSLGGVINREKAAIGVLITMLDPTGPMKEEAVTAGFFESKTWGKKYPKIQLLTIAELLAGKKIDMPPIKQVDATFKRAEKHKAEGGKQLEIKDPDSK